MARSLPRYRPPTTIGAETNQLGQKRGARVANPPTGLSTGGAHDWSAFDSFKAMNARTPVQAPVAAAPSLDPFRLASARAAQNLAVPAPHAPMLAQAANVVAGAVGNIGRSPAPAARPMASTAPAAPVMANEIPGRFTDTSGVQHSYTTAGGVQERGYDPTQDQTRSGVTTVDPFNRNNWTRTVTIDPRYGGGTAQAVNGTGYTPPSPGQVMKGIGQDAFRTSVGIGASAAGVSGASSPLGVTPPPPAAPAPVRPGTYNAGESVGQIPGKVGAAAVNVAQGAGNFLAGAAHGLAPGMEQSGRNVVDAAQGIGRSLIAPSKPGPQSVLAPVPEAPPQQFTNDPFEIARAKRQRIGQM